jgi:hypothetical protein
MMVIAGPALRGIEGVCSRCQEAEIDASQLITGCPNPKIRLMKIVLMVTTTP